MFDVIIYQEGMTLPTEGTFYVVAGDGTWLHKDTGICKCFVPVQSVSFLDDLKGESSAEVLLPKIPFEHVWKIKEFFRRVVEVHRSEAEVTLYYNSETGDYKIHVPTQEVSYGGVKYKRMGIKHLPEFQGYNEVGTIHSHCDFGAFHSGTDIGDEKDFDGLHITFGHNNLDEFSISASIVVTRFRTEVDPLGRLEGIERAGEEKPQCRDNFYKLVTASDEDKARWNAEVDEWMTKVSKHSYLPWKFGRKKADESWLDNIILPHFSLGPLVEVVKFAKGDKIVWDGETGGILRTEIGLGPFEVLECIGRKVTISANVGLLTLDDRFFKKYEETSEDKKG